MSLDAEAGAFRQHLVTSLREHWRFYLIEGIILVLLGGAAIVLPQIATLSVAIIIGWILLFSGGVGLVSTFQMRPAPGFWWSLLSALIAIVAGIILLASPVVGAISLTFVLITFFVVEGIASIMFGLDHRRELPNGWLAMFVSGVVDLILAVVIFLGLPGSAAWAIGLLVGINMIFGGVALAAMAWQARSLGGHALKSAP